MTGYKNAFREVVRSYEAERLRAEALSAKLRDEIYEKLPRIREIDDELASVGIELAKLALGDGGDAGEVKIKTGVLRSERNRILTENKFPEDFSEGFYKCKLCRDTGYIDGERGFPSRCRCMKQKLIDVYYDMSEVRGAFEHENFEDFDHGFYSDEINPDEGLSPRKNIQAVYQTALRYVRRFDAEFENLLLYGETGLGKTYICNCIAKSLIESGKTVLYMSAPRLFGIIEKNRFNRDEFEEPEESAEAFIEADLLVIDDLGAEFPTLVTSAALFDILNRRLLLKKSVVISTNLSQKGIESQYSERIVSRLLGNYIMLKFFGDDIRVKKKYLARRQT